MSNTPTLMQSEEANAPWNEPIEPWIETEITLSQSLSKDYKVTTKGEFSEEDSNEILKDNNILPPDQLMLKASTLLGRLYNHAPLKDRHEILNVINQLEHWTVDDQCIA